MQVYVTRGIKDIVAEFPGVGKILEEYDIGCSPCTMGICQLKDILDIHKLSKEAEVELMLRIEAEIYPDRNVASQTKAPPLQNTSSEKFYFSRALQILVDEHIHKENEVLFPWLDSRLTKEEKEELVARFEKSNRNLSLDNRKYQSFIEGLEQQLK